MINLESWKDNFVFDFFYKVRSFFRNIISTIKWLPVIWRDRQFDEYFLYAILEHKFQLMENHFRYKGMHVGSERDANQMKVCRLLLQRLMEENYNTPYDERNKLHFDWFRLKMKKAFGEVPNEKGYFVILEGKESDEPDGRWILPASKHEDYLKKQDLNLLCSIINKYAVRWWD